MIRLLHNEIRSSSSFSSSGANFPRECIDRARITACQTNRNKRPAQRRGRFIHQGTHHCNAHCSSMIVDNSGCHERDPLSSDNPFLVLHCSRAQPLTIIHQHEILEIMAQRCGSPCCTPIRHEIHHRHQRRSQGMT